MEKVDFAVIIPQRKEYEVFKSIFLVPESVTPRSLPDGGVCVLADPLIESDGGRMRLAICHMMDMYNYPCLALTERLIPETNPEYIFLLGSGCGNIRKVNILDVVVSTESVAYLGRGRRKTQGFTARPYTVPVERTVHDALTIYMDRFDHRFASWNRKCRSYLKRFCPETELPERLSAKSTYEVKGGVVASDDMVLSFRDETAAERFWDRFREDAKVYDMESAGFSYSCHDRSNPRHWVVVRGISDHGLYKKPKYHRAAAVVAAVWLRGFITYLAKQSLQVAEVLGEPPGVPKDYPWRRLYDLLESAQKSRNRFVGKRRFVRETLQSNHRDCLALEFAIRRHGIKEREVPNPKVSGRSTTAIALDKRSDFWYNKLEFKP